MIKYDVLKFTTVFIENTNNKGETSSGTGFFVGFKDKPTVLVTAKHVVKNTDYLKISFHYMPTGSTHIATIDFKCKPEWDESNDYDICCCDLSKINKEFEKLIGFPIYNKYISSDSILSEKDLKDVEVLQEVVMLGYPGSMKNTAFAYPIVSKGTLAVPPRDNTANDEGYINMATVGGHSGSPLLLKTEKGYALLGILSQSLMENPISSADIAMYVDAYRLNELIKEI